MRRTIRTFADIFILAFGNSAARKAVFERVERERRSVALRRYIVR